MPLLDDTTTWIAVGLSAGAIALAVIVLAATVVALARGRRSARTLADEMLSRSSEKFETVVASLASALERAEDEGRRSRRLGAIRESLDLDAVLARTLDAAAGIPGVDAAMIALPEGTANGGSKPILATIGLSADESAGEPIGGPPDGSRARAVAISYRYPPEQDDDEQRILGGLAVPLVSEAEESIGTLAVFWRSEQPGGTEAHVDSVEEIARSAGPAIDNARRFRQARLLADLDALTKLHNRRFFHETLGREVARAQRYERRLALLVLDIDDFKAINDRVGHLAGDALLAEVGERVSSVVRGADVACRIGGDEFAVILPEATRADAEQLYRRLELAVASRPVGSSDRLHLSAGIAEIRPEDDSTSFFERADEALYRAKQSGKGHAVTADQQL
jgi:diguanylate cyclase (GGDEF)-like protein